ncbi:TIGR03013 family PEP-CTERM/XrtA system glycosyltransferase [Crocinitomicaceae bacterium]|nr:TIGR03013 family PEP-CTERM/XrtA system glycosyltransferase [Crocinitomicaceae bacterium]
MDNAKNTASEVDREAVSHVRFFSHSTRLFQHHIPTEFVLLGIIEFTALVLAFYIGHELRFDAGWHEHQWLAWPRAITFAVVMQTSLIAFGAYQRQANHSGNLLAVRIGASLLLGSVILGLIYYIAPVFLTGRGVLALSVFVSFVAVVAIRLVFNRILDAYDLRLRVLVLGAGKAANLVRVAEAAGEIQGVNITTYMPMPGDQQDDRGIGLSQTAGALVKYVAVEKIDVILLALDERRKGLPVHDLIDCKMSGVEVIDLLTFFERYTNKIRLDIVQPSWLFLSEGFQVSNLKRLGKWLFDMAAVLLLLPIVLPVGLLVSLAILVESKFAGPVLYSQMRVGKDGRLFHVYKFRSMVTDAEKDGVARWAKMGDTRVTRVGAILRRSRLDEIPQLFNIIKGDMSFVGPRPERPEFVQSLAEQIPYYNERHRVKPGLSGWAQIRYPYGASIEDGLEKLQYDLYYVKNYSILLDALVLLQTAEVVLLGRGAQ